MLRAGPRALRTSKVSFCAASLHASPLWPKTCCVCLFFSVVASALWQADSRKTRASKVQCTSRKGKRLVLRSALHLMQQHVNGRAQKKQRSTHACRITARRGSISSRSTGFPRRPRQTNTVWGGRRLFLRRVTFLLSQLMHRDRDADAREELCTAFDKTAREWAGPDKNSTYSCTWINIFKKHWIPKN
jgi:hypothetical protein